VPYIDVADKPYLAVIAGLLALGMLAFLGYFLAPAVALYRRLGRVLKKLNAAEYSGPVDLESVFVGQGVLAHLWREFRETLHEERSLNPTSGVHEVVALRATLPAETFFTAETVVETPVRAEFFKHLPGIFTGIGIIGTFTGLIVGLKAFDVSENPSVVRESLNALLTSVGEAFFISAIAISMAMATTAIEKALLVRLYRRLEQLNQALDNRFKSGVGEEYLSRLVVASEESASQTKILKDALVQDLRTILTELTERQIAATAQGHVKLGEQITRSLGDGLKDPLDKIANAVNQVGRDQGTAVQQLLTDVLASFGQRLQDLFGSQLSGIHEMQQQTINALQTAVAKLETMAATFERAGQRVTDTMGSQLTDALGKMDSRQRVMNEEMRKFVTDIRTLVSQSQSETSEHLHNVLRDLAQQAESLVGELSARSQQHVETMGGQVEGLAKSMEDASAQMTAAVTRMEAVTTSAVGQMNSSAETLAIAADDFAKAGQSVTSVLSKTEGLTQQLTQAAGGVSVAARSLDGVIADYKASREAVSTMLATVKQTVESAIREASITHDVVQRIEQSAERLAIAQKVADEYLGQVTAVLEEAHATFAESIQKTLHTGNKEFYDSLTQATRLLREAIQELESTLGSVSPSVARSR
jgi:ABC-type transporter Mla subunit MlaD